MTWMTKDTALFRGGEQTQNFTRMAMIHPCRRIAHAPDPRPIPVADEALTLPATADGPDGPFDVARFLADTRTTGLMVVRGGRVRLERYWQGLAPRTQHISFSVAKSFVSTLVAFALRDGHIDSLDDPVDRYAPELAGSGYAGVALRDVLQMSSGVRWNEDYGDADSDVARFAAAFEAAGSFDDVAASLPRQNEPGTFNRYNSCDTHVLGMVVARATGMAVAEYLEATLWHPLGMEDDGFFLVDGRGVEASAMGLNVTLRDFAKLGLLFVDGGHVDGRQLLPPGWWEACRTVTAPHLRPGVRDSSNYPHGYSYQWWLPDESGAFCAMGVYYQYVWVDPANDTVVVKTSADPRFGQVEDFDGRVDQQHFALFRALTAAAAP